MAASADVLEAQRAYFASDDRIRERVQLWADATPAQRLAELRDDDHLLDRIADDVLDRLHRVRSGLPPDTIAILERLRAGQAK